MSRVRSLSLLLFACRDYGYEIGGTLDLFTTTDEPTSKDMTPTKDTSEDMSKVAMDMGCANGMVFEAEYRGYTAIPHDITITVGTTVRWTNRDPQPHTVTEGAPGAVAPAFDTPNIPANGGSAELVFCKAASYTYWCRTHSKTMYGYQLTVEP